MRFKNAKEMYEYIIQKGDLYNKRTGHYIFEYNDAHALCVYALSQAEMLECAKKALALKETFISAVLGTGGIIYDDSTYDHFRYSDIEEECALYLAPSIKFCEDWFDSKFTDFVLAEEFFTLAKIEEVEELNRNTPDGQIIDADTILADAISKCEYNFTGCAQDMFNIWKNSSDKNAVEQMFYEFTDIEFADYLEKCKEYITRNEHEYILSADSAERAELAKHLSLNGYTAHLNERDLLIVSEEERCEVNTILEDRFISSCMRGPTRQIDITKEEIECCDDLIMENGKINATYELHMDVDNYFGWETRYHDNVWINFYTDWHPDGSITASYTVDGDLYFNENWQLTTEEQEFFRNKMENYCNKLRGTSLSKMWMDIAEDDTSGLIRQYLSDNNYYYSIETEQKIYEFLETLGLDLLTESYSDFITDALCQYSKDLYILSRLGSIVFEETAENAHETSFYYLAPVQFLEKLVEKTYRDAASMGIRIDFPLRKLDVAKASVSVSPIRFNNGEDVWESYDWTDISLHETTIQKIVKVYNDTTE